jgi:hypothetical protein
MQIPKDIESRITWTRRKDEAWSRVQRIKPYTPCEDCGRELTETRIVKTSTVVSPWPHRREHCKTCNRHRHQESKDWYDNPHYLNAVMKTAEYAKKYQDLNDEDK